MLRANVSACLAVVGTAHRSHLLYSLQWPLICRRVGRRPPRTRLNPSELDNKRFSDDWNRFESIMRATSYFDCSKNSTTATWQYVDYSLVIIIAGPPEPFRVHLEASIVPHQII